LGDGGENKSIERETAFQPKRGRHKNGRGPTIKRKKKTGFTMALEGHREGERKEVAVWGG